MMFQIDYYSPNFNLALSVYAHICGHLPVSAPIKRKPIDNYLTISSESRKVKPVHIMDDRGSLIDVRA